MTPGVAVRLPTRVTVVEADDRPAPLAALVPAMRAVSDAIVADASERGSAACRVGCAACCRHTVPVTEPEIRRLAELVAQLPPLRRAEIEARFDAAKARLAAAGLLERLRTPPADPTHHGPLIEATTRAWVDCPFLEAERCGIYADRPSVCRDYAVRSHPALCAAPLDNPIEPLRPVAYTAAVFAAALRDVLGAPVKVTPLPLALDWAAAHPDTTRVSPRAVVARVAELLADR